MAPAVETHRSLSVDGNKTDFSSATKLVMATRELDLSSVGELWIVHEPGPAICALINVKQGMGWLMYLDATRDGSRSTRNPDYQGPGDGMLDYMLSNGQLDRYPASWTYEIRALQQALVEFAQSARLPECVAWVED